MKFFRSILLFCVSTFLVSTHVAGEVSQKVTLILAAEMPDISDPSTGQYAQLQKLIKNTKESSPTTFFLFGGGSIGPSALSNLDRGSHIVDILNTLEPDVMGIAKREFSYFEDELSLRSYEAAFPLVSSNIIDTRVDTVLDGLANQAIIKKGKTKLGFISIVNERLIDEYLLKNVKVLEPISTATARAKSLREAGADAVILHSFHPYPFISELIQSGVIDFAFISATRLSDNLLAEVLKHPNILHINVPGSALVAEVSLSPERRQVLSSNLISLETIAADVLVKSQVDGYQLRLDRLLDDTIGIWGGEFSTQRNIVRVAENAFGNFVADSMRSAADADVALINSGSIRGDKIYRMSTSITRKTIASELPFRSTLSIIRIKGRDLVDALEIGFAGLDDERGSFPQVSGMQIVFDSKKEKGKRIDSIKINNEAIDLEKDYVLATTNYLLEGGDGYSPLAQGDVLNTSSISQNILISDLVQRNVRLQGKLSKVIDGRLLDKSAGVKQ